MCRTSRRIRYTNLMPELPDIAVYLDCLRPRVLGHTLTRVRHATNATGPKLSIGASAYNSFTGRNAAR